MLFPVLNLKAKSSWKREIWCWACGSQFLNVWMNWIIYLQRISELFKWRWLYLITLHAMGCSARFILSLRLIEYFRTLCYTWFWNRNLWLALSYLIKEFSRFMILEFMLLFHVVTWLSKINVKCQRQQWSVSLVQINHHYVRKMEQKRLSVNSWTSTIWVMASKMLGNNDNDSWLHLGVRIRWINNACFAKMQF